VRNRHVAFLRLHAVTTRSLQALDDVQGQLDGLSSSCGAISAALASARATASGLLADADKAGRELGALEAKRHMVEQFLDKYQLTPEEVRCRTTS
jgi:DNA repair ATPase RecN